MPFNTALSGIRAANEDLRVTGNNIANASTTGFKQSRAEFGDVYATSVLGSGSNQVGSGVRVQDVSQQFSQGNIAFTENTLDLAISGGGFFVVSQGGDQLFSRSGAFSLDQEGYVINNTNARLQGFTADSGGSIGGIIGDLQIDTDNLAPEPTSEVNSVLNLNSTEEVIQRSGTTFTSDGNVVAVTQAGIESPTITALDSGSFNLPLANDFNTTALTFDLSVSGSTGNNGTLPVSLSTASGVPATISTFNDLRTLASVINSQIFSPTAPATPIDVVATAEDLGGGNYQIGFETLQSGESSTIGIASASANASQIGLAGANPPGAVVPGVAAVSNGYPSQSIDFTNPDGDVATYTSSIGNSAAQTASELNALSGISATANTEATLRRSGFVNSANNMQVTLNGIALSGATIDDLANQINSLSTSTLPGITAVIDPVTTNLVVSSSIGDDLRFAIDSTDDGDSVEIIGNSSAPSQILEVDTGGGTAIAGAIDASGNAIITGGSIDIVMEEGYSAGNPTPGIGLFSAFGIGNSESVVINEFDPRDPSTYNHATSVTIYDSLGNPHAMEQYFVKQPYDPDDPTTAANHWRMYVQIDGANVGDPDTTLASPLNTEPTVASYDQYFNTDGSLDTVRSDDALISNWTPLDANGDEIGALDPLNLLQGGTTNIETPATSSNFVISLDGTTQVGSPFEVNNVDQNGFPSGRLSGVSFSDSGVIFARFTNGEAQVLGQLALADFTNTQGLQPASDSMWSQSFESGQPIIGPPGTASLGLIQAGALEESNVDLSEQLVNLIIAQRNFQASAKTIETADSTTQTIINLR